MEFKQIDIVLDGKVTNSYKAQSHKVDAWYANGLLQKQFPEGHVVVETDLTEVGNAIAAKDKHRATYMGNLFDMFDAVLDFCDGDPKAIQEIINKRKLNAPK